MLRSSYSGTPTIGVQVGTYDVRDDSYNFSSVQSVSLPVGDSLDIMSYRIYPFSDSQSLDIRDYLASKISFSNLNLNSTDSYRFLLNNFCFDFFLSGVGQSLFNNTAYPFLCYLDFNISGTVRIVDGNTYRSGESTVRVPLSNPVSNFNFRSNYTGYYADLDFVVNVPKPDNIFISGYEYEFVSYSSDSFDLVLVYNFSDTNIFNFSDNLVNSNTSLGCGFSTYSFPGYFSILVDEGFVSGSDSMMASGFQSINGSISTMSNNITNQITQVKTQLTTSTNTITTKIDTMSQNIQTGLQNVITSAQQNTQNIINTVTTKVDEVKTGITEVKDSILDLPSKISEMLIGLVVPDEETMIAQKEQWEQLLSDRFGVVYESVAMVDSVVGAFTDNGTTSTITMPTVTVPVAGEDFVFGGYEVDVVPQGFSVLVEALKLIIDIVVTLAFINAMKNRYEQLVSR